MGKPIDQCIGLVGDAFAVTINIMPQKLVALSNNDRAPYLIQDIVAAFKLSGLSSGIVGGLPDD